MKLLYCTYVFRCRRKWYVPVKIMTIGCCHQIRIWRIDEDVVGFELLEDLSDTQKYIEEYFAEGNTVETVILGPLSTTAEWVPEERFNELWAIHRVGILIGTTMILAPKVFRTFANKLVSLARNLKKRCERLPDLESYFIEADGTEGDGCVLGFFLFLVFLFFGLPWLTSLLAP